MWTVRFAGSQKYGIVWGWDQKTSIPSSTAVRTSKAGYKVQLWASSKYECVCIRTALFGGFCEVKKCLMWRLCLLVGERVSADKLSVRFSWKICSSHFTHRCNCMFTHILYIFWSILDEIGYMRLRTYCESHWNWHSKACHTVHFCAYFTYIMTDFCEIL